MSDQFATISSFIRSLSNEEKRRLFNDLLAVEEVYRQNKNASFYTFKKLRRATKRHHECRKRIFQYKNNLGDELVIQQIHEQHLFKNHYRFHVFFNLVEQDFNFVQLLLIALREELCVHYTQPKIALV